MPENPVDGLYEALISESVAELVRHIAERVDQSRIGPGIVSDRVPLHVSEVLIRSLAGIVDRERVTTALNLTRDILNVIGQTVGVTNVNGDQLVAPGEILTAIKPLNAAGQPRSISRPHVPLLETTLLTNAPGEPRVGAQLLSEIDSADRISIIMAFVRRSGIRPFLDALGQFCSRATAEQPLRILTTIYTGSTEKSALEELQSLGADVRISYDLSMTRLHAKAWLFHRDSGYSTGFVGSSNLTHSAQVNGLEWNLRISGRPVTRSCPLWARRNSCGTRQQGRLTRSGRSMARGGQMAAGTASRSVRIHLR